MKIDKSTPIGSLEMAELPKKIKKLDNVLKNMSKKFGTEKATVLSEINFRGSVINTGSLVLNQMTGIGGLPLGKITEIFGLESSGKTTLSAAIVAQAQREGLTCAFIDTEHAVDPNWFATLGVDIKKLAYFLPSYQEEAFNMVEMLTESGDVDLIVFDSIAATPSKAEYEGEAGDVHVGGKARLANQHMRKMVPKLYENKTTMILINQVRTAIGVMYGNPETRPGGKGLDFASSLMLRTSKKAIVEKDHAIGDMITVKCVKNKLGGSPGRKADLKLLYGVGFDLTHEVLTLGTELGFVSKKGAWYRPTFLLEEGQTEEDLEKFQGVDMMLEYLTENADKMEQLKTLVQDNLEKVKLEVEEVTDAEVAEAESFSAISGLEADSDGTF